MNNTSRYAFILFPLAGILFAATWASASTATRLALQSAQPFVIAVSRFFLAALLMLLVSHGLMRWRKPRGAEWKQLAIYGLLNISIYLGLYVMAMTMVSAGLGTLAVCTNPVFISLMSAFTFRRKVSASVWISLFICSAGIVVASWPLVQNSYARPAGIVLLLLSMVAYSAGAIYYTGKPWNGLHPLVINGWQTLLGGLFLLPLMLFYWNPDANLFRWTTWGGILWLAIPVSIGAVQLWLYLLKQDTVKAAFWLYLCPVFGFAIARWLLAEPLSGYTVAGVLLVITGLLLIQRSPKH